MRWNMHFLVWTDIHLDAFGGISFHFGVSPRQKRKRVTRGTENAENILGRIPKAPFPDLVKVSNPLPLTARGAGRILSLPSTARVAIRVRNLWLRMTCRARWIF